MFYFLPPSCVVFFMEDPIFNLKRLSVLNLTQWDTLTDCPFIFLIGLGGRVTNFIGQGRQIEISTQRGRNSLKELLSSKICFQEKCFYVCVVQVSHSLLCCKYRLFCRNCNICYAVNTGCSVETAIFVLL